MVFGGILARRGYPTGDVLNETRWRRLDKGTGSSGELRSCEFCRGVLWRPSLFTEGTRLCRENRIFLLKFRLLAGQRIFSMLVKSALWLIHRVLRTSTIPTTSGDGWRGLYIKMECILTLWVFSAKFCWKCWVINKNGGGAHYWTHIFFIVYSFS